MNTHQFNGFVDRNNFYNDRSFFNIVGFSPKGSTAVTVYVVKPVIRKGNVTKKCLHSFHISIPFLSNKTSFSGTGQ